MKIFKFRAWDKGNGIMIYPLPASNNTSGDILNRWDDEHLMQFTGLTDKNDKEMFADDLLSDGEIIFRIYDVSGGFVIKEKYWAKNTGILEFDDLLVCIALSDLQTISWIKSQCEVIGNIYENPELIIKS